VVVHYDGAYFSPAETTTLPTIKYTYLANGTYKVAVRVTDDDATTAIAAMTVTVKDLSPAAVVSCPEKTNERDGAQFDASGSVSSPDKIEMWEWDFNFNPAPGFLQRRITARKRRFYKFADAGVYKVAVP
jgi:PKD repeat protein